jgi:hypothetical protein
MCENSVDKDIDGSTIESNKQTNLPDTASNEACFEILGKSDNRTSSIER